MPRCSSLYYFPEARCETRFGIFAHTFGGVRGKQYLCEQQSVKNIVKKRKNIIKNKAYHLIIKGL